MEDTTNSLRWGEGSGMRIASRWQLGVFVECMKFAYGNRGSLLSRLSGDS